MCQRAKNKYWMGRPYTIDGKTREFATSVMSFAVVEK